MRRRLLALLLMIVLPAVAAAAAEPEVSDGMLELKVKLALIEALKLDGVRISAKASEGVVWLTGEVQARSSQESAEAVAAAVEGVKDVKNDLRVAKSAAPEKTPVARGVGEAEREVNDGLLEVKVKSRLFEAVGRTAFSLEIEAADGVVSLSGTVADKDRAGSAVKAVETVDGVKKVIDLIKVKGS